MNINNIKINVGDAIRLYFMSIVVIQMTMFERTNVWKINF